MPCALDFSIKLSPPQKQQQKQRATCGLTSSSSFEKGAAESGANSASTLLRYVFKSKVLMLWWSIIRQKWFLLSNQLTRCRGNPDSATATVLSTAGVGLPRVKARQSILAVVRPQLPASSTLCSINIPGSRGRRRMTSWLERQLRESSPSILHPPD